MVFMVLYVLYCLCGIGASGGRVTCCLSGAGVCPAPPCLQWPRCPACFLLPCQSAVSGCLLRFGLLGAVCCFVSAAPVVTKRRNSGKRCNSTSNSGKPQKAHSETESQPTSAEQQHRTEAHEQDPKKSLLRCALGVSCSLWLLWALLVFFRSVLLVCARGPAWSVPFGVSRCCLCCYTYSHHCVSL